MNATPGYLIFPEFFQGIDLLQIFVYIVKYYKFSCHFDNKGKNEAI